MTTATNKAGTPLDYLERLAHLPESAVAQDSSKQQQQQQQHLQQHKDQINQHQLPQHHPIYQQHQHQNEQQQQQYMMAESNMVANSKRNFTADINDANSVSMASKRQCTDSNSPGANSGAAGYKYNTISNSNLGLYFFLLFLLINSKRTNEMYKHLKKNILKNHF